MRFDIPALVRRSALVAAALTVAAATTIAMAGPAFADSNRGERDSGRVSLEEVRQAVARYHNLDTALDSGYAKFLTCTALPGVGGMGQHYVNGKLAADPAIDPLHPEALVYQPLTSGQYRLVAIEYVTFKSDWDRTHSSPPSLFGHTFGTVLAPNIFGLPDFYELHVWLFKPNPLGMFFEWNPRVACPPGT